MAVFAVAAALVCNSCRRQAAYFLFINEDRASLSDRLPILTYCHRCTTIGRIYCNGTDFLRISRKQYAMPPAICIGKDCSERCPTIKNPHIKIPK